MDKHQKVREETEFVNHSRTYSKIVEHRIQCKKWHKSFCLDCFGGGLNNFIKELAMEKYYKR